MTKTGLAIGRWYGAVGETPATCPGPAYILMSYYAVTISGP